VRLLAEPSVDVVGLSSAHFNNADLVTFDMWNQYLTKGIKTVAISQQLNEEILWAMHKESIPHPLVPIARLAGPGAVQNPGHLLPQPN
jgi:purine nucleosidase